MNRDYTSHLNDILDCFVSHFVNFVIMLKQNNQDLSKCTVKEDTLCSEAGGDCLSCKFEEIIDTCIYGKPVNVSCSVEDSIKCLVRRALVTLIICCDLLNVVPSLISCVGVYVTGRS